MEKEFVPYEQALDLKKLGFNEPCFGTYNFKKDLYYFPITNGLFKNSDIKHEYYKHFLDRIASPLYSQVFKWFRDKHNLFGCIDVSIVKPNHWFIRIDNINTSDYIYHSEDENLLFDSYEKAELECLKKLIEIVKNKK